LQTRIEKLHLSGYQIAYMYRNLTCFIVTITLLATASHAQFSKGMKMSGVTLGNAFFKSGSYDYTFPQATAPYSSKTNSLGLTLAPNLGWFISNNTVIGARLALGYYYDKNLDMENGVTFRKKIDKNFNAGLGVFLRNYFGSFSNLAPFAQFNMDGRIGSSHTEGFNYSTNFKETFSGKSSGDFTFDLGLSVGVTKMLNSNVGIDIFAGYLFDHSKNTFKTTTWRDVDIDGSIDETDYENPTTKSTNHGFMIGAGFQIFLSKNK